MTAGLTPDTALNWLLPAGALVLLVLIWQLYIDISGVNELLLPPPHAVARALVDDRGTLLRNLGRTALEIVCGIWSPSCSGSPRQS